MVEPSRDLRSLCARTRAQGVAAMAETDDVRRRPAQRATAPPSLLPTALARRQSSSYKHLRKNNLVSNSPFKSPPSNQNSNLAISSPPSPSPNTTLGSSHTKVHPSPL